MFKDETDLEENIIIPETKPNENQNSQQSYTDQSLDNQGIAGGKGGTDGADGDDGIILSLLQGEVAQDGDVMLQ